jgi:hypothetical protein
MTALAAIVLAGCGSASTSHPAATPLPSGHPSVDALRAVTSALQDAATTRAQYSMTISGDSSLGGSASASGTFDFANALGSQELKTYAGTEQLVFTPDTVYIHQAGKPLPGTLPWLSYSTNDAGTLSPNFVPIVLQSGQINPGFILSELQWGAILASNDGPGTVNGVAVTRYAVTVNLHHAVLMTGPAAKMYLQSISQETTFITNPDGSVKPVLIEADINNSGKLVGISLSPPGGEVGNVTLTLQKFGVAVSANPPPSNQVTDMVTSPTGTTGTTETPGHDGDSS